jgi:hypothetical protein
MNTNAMPFDCLLQNPSCRAKQFDTRQVSETFTVASSPDRDDFGEGTSAGGGGTSLPRLDRPKKRVLPWAVPFWPRGRTKGKTSFTDALPDSKKARKRSG